MTHDADTVGTGWLSGLVYFDLSHVLATWTRINALRPGPLSMRSSIRQTGQHIITNPQECCLPLRRCHMQVAACSSEEAAAVIRGQLEAGALRAVDCPGLGQDAAPVRASVHTTVFSFHQADHHKNLSKFLLICKVFVLNHVLSRCEGWRISV